MRGQFLSDPEDVRWLLETHLKGAVCPPFASFVLYGNEDAPEAVELYESAGPEIQDVPHRIDLTGGAK